MKRTTPLKRTRMTPGEKSRTKRQRRAEFVAAFIAANPKCRARVTVWCKRKAQPTEDVHEPWSRGRGGPVNVEAASLPVCRECHNWIHDNPEMAEVRGLLVPSHLGAEWLAAGGVLR